MSPCCRGMADIFDQMCCQPKVASIIVGYLAAFDSLFIAIKCFAGYNHELVTLITLTKGEPPRDLEYRALNSICTTRAIFNVALFVLCLMMLYGIYQDQPSCMMPWLVSYLVVLMMDSILILMSCIWMGGIYILIYGIFIALRAFGLYIVFRYYLDLSYGYMQEEPARSQITVTVEEKKLIPE